MRAAVQSEALRDVINHPRDDTPRLMYADWLEDNGGDPEQAEFIRVQVEIAAGPPGFTARCFTGMGQPPLNSLSFEPLDDLATLPRHGEIAVRCRGQDNYWLVTRGFFFQGPEKSDGLVVIYRSEDIVQWKPHLVDREKELIRHTRKWLPEYVKHADCRLDWARGFVNILHCPWERFRNIGQAFVKEQPVTRVNLADKRSDSYRAKSVWRLVPSVHRWLSDEVPRELIPYLILAAKEYDGQVSSGQAVTFNGDGHEERAKAAMSCAALLWAKASPASSPRAGSRRRAAQS